MKMYRQGDGKEAITKRQDCRKGADTAAEDRRFWSRWKTLNDDERGKEILEMIRQMEESRREVDELMKQCAKVCFC